jgi:hypothetical protein
VARTLRGMRYLFIFASCWLAACASAPQSVPYTWQGQPGAAALEFGSPDAATAAFRKDESGCEYETQKAAVTGSQVFAGGPTVNAFGNSIATGNRRASLFDACMRSRGWYRGE